METPTTSSRSNITSRNGVDKVKSKVEEATNKNTHVLLKKINERYMTLVQKTLKGDECAICLEKQDKLVLLPNCNHYFCKSCIEEHSASNDKCPICREEMIGYIDSTTSKLVSLKKEQESDSVKIIQLDELGLAHIVAGNEVYHTYLTKDSPFKRIRTNVKCLVIGIAIGVAYCLYKEKK